MPPPVPSATVGTIPPGGIRDPCIELTDPSRLRLSLQPDGRLTMPILLLSPPGYLPMKGLGFTATYDLRDCRVLRSSLHETTPRRTQKMSVMAVRTAHPCLVSPTISRRLQRAAEIRKLPAFPGNCSKRRGVLEGMGGIGIENAAAVGAEFVGSQSAMPLARRGEVVL